MIQKQQQHYNHHLYMGIHCIKKVLLTYPQGCAKHTEANLKPFAS